MFASSRATTPAHLGIADRFLPPDLRGQGSPAAAEASLPQPHRRLLLPGPGHQPSFDEVARIATVAALFQQSVCVLCLERTIEEAWQQRRLSPEIQAATFDLLLYRTAPTTRWQTFLAANSYDLVVFHGAEAALRAARLTPVTLTSLVQATNAALVMVA